LCESVACFVDLANEIPNTLETKFASASAGKVFVCLIILMKEGKHYVDVYECAWLNKPFSLLTTTQNTRDLGVYRTKDGTFTKEEVLLHAGVNNKDIVDNYVFTKEYGRER